MRILVIANLPPYVLGGAENQVARLVEAWIDAGHRVEVAGHRIPSGEGKVGVFEVPIHHIATIDWLGRPGRAISYFLSLAKLLYHLGSEFDVIYCRGLGDGAISICLLKAVGIVDLPMVACPINAKGAGDVYFIRSIPGWPWIVATINRHCEAINIIAPAIEDDLVKTGITPHHLSRIPNGAPLMPAPVRRRVAPVRRLIWTGRFSPQKGLDVLLSALATVAGAGYGFDLELIGEGPERKNLLILRQELRLDDRVHFSGKLGKTAIRQRLIEADVFVLPSRYEGMSNAVLEAMEARLPIVLTRCGGIDAYVDSETGWLCNPDDPEDLARALVSMLKTPENKLLSMGLRARILVERHFAMPAVARRNLELLASIAINGQEEK